VVKSALARTSNRGNKATIPVQDMPSSMCFITVSGNNPSLRESPKNKAANTFVTYYTLPETTTNIRNKTKVTNGIPKTKKQIAPKMLKPLFSETSKSPLLSIRPAQSSTTEEFGVIANDDLITRCTRLQRDKKLLIRKLKYMRREAHSLRQQQYKDLLIRRRIGKALKKIFTVSQRQKVLYGKRVRDWDEQTLNNALVLKQYSRGAYLYLKNCLHYPLPAIKTLQNWQNPSNSSDSADT